MADLPASISALARQGERNYAEIHADVEQLADYRVGAFEREGQARRPYIPDDLAWSLVSQHPPELTA
jgi:predicted transcriptional regulator